MSRFFFISLFFLFHFSFNLLAQTISGFVKDARTKEPLVGVNIVVVGSKFGTVTDAKGQFSLTLSNKTNNKLKFSFVGYQSQEATIEFGQKLLQINLKPIDIVGDVVEVNAYRVDYSSASTFETLSAEKIRSNHLVQDIPYLLNQSASVVATSDAGNGVGYSGLRIRGIDPARINVTINGIPWNDAESHSMYWVDVPDLAASVNSIQIQRGVGTSTNGPAAFGATIDLQTNSFRPESYSELTFGLGSFNTKKQSLLLGSGLLGSGWIFDGRISSVTSDGYVDRAWSDLRSANLSATHYGKNDVLEFDYISGYQKTYQAWNGISEADLKINRRMNYYTYDNQADNYVQNHYQLHYKYSFSDQFNVNTSLFLTRGAGFYEEYKPSADLLGYKMDTTIQRYSDLIRRKWLDNSFYGFVFSIEYEPNHNLKNIFGGSVSNYIGDHYGEVIWATYFLNRNIRHRYNNNTGKKSDVSLYNKTIFKWSEDKTFFADLQIRKINYDFLGFDASAQQANQTDDLLFFNPKIGFSWNVQDNLTTYISLSKASKEPTRDEYVNSTPLSRPKSETLLDLESGLRWNIGSSFLNVNVYYMDYYNQLVLTGEINDIGEYVRTNVPQSYRFGLETEMGIRPADNFKIEGNISLSTSAIKEFNYFIDDYDHGTSIKEIFHNQPIAFSPQIVSNFNTQLEWNGLINEINVKYVGKQYLDNTADSRKSLDAYLTTDLKFRYILNSEHLSYFKTINLIFAVNNLFNVMYSSNGYTYSYIAGNALSINNYYFPQAERNVLFQSRFEF